MTSTIHRRKPLMILCSHSVHADHSPLLRHVCYCGRQCSYWRVGGHITVLLANTPKARLGPWPGAFEGWFRVNRECVPLTGTYITVSCNNAPANPHAHFAELEPDQDSDVMERSFGEPEFRALPDHSTIHLVSGLCCHLMFAYFQLLSAFCPLPILCCASRAIHIEPVIPPSIDH